MQVILSIITQNIYYLIPLALLLLIGLSILFRAIYVRHLVNRCIVNFENKQVLEKNLEKLKSMEAMNKSLIKLQYEHFLAKERKEKALHFMQIMIELNLIKNEYEMLFHQTQMAYILFYDLNQTSSAFNKLHSVKEKGYYSYQWNLMMTDIFISQGKFESASKYCQQALKLSSHKDIEKRKAAIDMVLMPKSASRILLEKKAFFKDVEFDLMIILNYLALQNYEKGIEYSDMVLNQEIPLFAKIYILMMKSYALFKNGGEYFSCWKSIGYILPGYFNVESYEPRLKRLGELLLIYAEYIDDDRFIERNRNLFNEKGIAVDLIVGRDTNQQFEPYSKLVQKRFDKKIERKLMILDFLELSGKKLLELKPYVAKMEFSPMFDLQKKSIDRTDLIKRFNRLSRKGMVKVSENIANLLGYQVKHSKYTGKGKYGTEGVNVKALAKYPKYSYVLIVVRRFKGYSLDNEYVEYLERIRRENSCDKLILISNIDFDSDILKYKEKFYNIEFYNSVRTGYLLHAIVTKKKDHQTT